MEGNLLDERTVIIDIDANSSDEALDALSTRLVELGYAKESFIEAVKARERVYATGLPANAAGVAIPHTDIEHVNKPALGIGVLKKPVRFRMMGSHDASVEVEIMFMIALNQHHSQIDMLQNLMALIQDDGLLTALKTSKTSKDIITLLKNKI